MFGLFKKELQTAYSYDDVTLIPQYSKLKSRKDASTKMKGFDLPIIMSPMDTVTTPQMIELFNEQNIPSTVHRAFNNFRDQYNYATKSNVNCQYINNTWFSVGSVGKYKSWIDGLFNLGVRKFCVDLAHGDSKACVDTVKYINKIFKVDIDKKISKQQHIIAGNVATKEGFIRLQKAGANGIRVGVASGQICSTALQTGFGVPILTNIIECAKVKKDTWLIADGGCKNTGDIAKAVFFGADFVMMGKMLASTNLACGDCYNKAKTKLVQKTKKSFSKTQFNCIYPEELEQKFLLAKECDRKYKKNIYKELCLRNVVAYKSYKGMASRSARNGVLAYASVQGVQGLTKYTGTTEQFIFDTRLRLQASLSYGGVINWNSFRKKVRACKRSNAGILSAETHLEVTFD